MEVIERFLIHDDYRALPINVGAISFATSNDCKKLTAINTVVFLAISYSLSQEGNEFVNRCKIQCK